MLIKYRYLIPERALNYIDEHGLFREEGNSNLKAPLQVSDTAQLDKSRPTANGSLVDGQVDRVSLKS